MARTTAYLALVQTLLVITGFFALGIVLKMAGYPDAPMLLWNPLAVFLRQNGAWLILLPILWAAWAAPAGRIDRGFLSQRLVFASGIGLAMLIMALFLYCAIFPYTRPAFIQMP